MKKNANSLYAFASKAQETLTAYEDISSILTRFSIFSKTKKDIIEQSIIKLSDAENVTFYGVGYYFKYVYRILADHITSNNIFFYDDNMFEDFEPSTNIKRSPLSDNVDTVILCSNSIDIQEDMFKQLKTAKTVIFPWRKIIEC